MLFLCVCLICSHSQEAAQRAHHLHSDTAGHPGSSVLQDPLPGHLHEGGGGPQDQLARVPCAGIAAVHAGPHHVRSDHTWRRCWTLHMYGLTARLSDMACSSLCFLRCGSRTAVPNAVSSSNKAVASPSPAPQRRRPPQCRRPVHPILSPTHPAPTAPPPPSQGPAWPQAPAPGTPLCPSGARPSPPCPTPWPPPRRPACSGPRPTP